MDNSFHMKTTSQKQKPLSVESIDPQIKVITLGNCTRTVWDCLMHFGDGRTDTFRAAVEAAKANNLEEGFMLSIGQARFDGNKEAFEDVAVEYATAFGNSPPDWIEAHTVVKKVKAQNTIIDVGNITEASAIETSIKMASPRAQILDLSNTQKSDSTGLELFNDALQSRLDEKSKTSMINGDRLVKHFLEKVRLIPSSQNPAVWNFIFHYCRLNNLKELFDQASAAIASAGGDLPKWQDLSDHESMTKEVEYEALGILVGESLSSINAEFAQMCLKTPQGIIANQEKKPLHFDMVKTKTGSLLDTAAVVGFTHVLQAERIPVCVFNVNEIFIEMFKVMGINAVVQSMLPPGATA